MIVVDTNVIAYLWVPGERTAAAEALLEHDDRWLAPPLWRSEFRNVLATLVRAGRITLPRALDAAARAEEWMALEELEVDTDVVLRLAAQTGCSAYDCEFAALADGLGVRFVTADKRLVKAFPGVAQLLDSAALG